MKSILLAVVIAATLSACSITPAQVQLACTDAQIALAAAQAGKVVTGGAEHTLTVTQGDTTIICAVAAATDPVVPVAAAPVAASQ